MPPSSGTDASERQSERCDAKWARLHNLSDSAPAGASPRGENGGTRHCGNAGRGPTVAKWEGPHVIMGRAYFASVVEVPCFSSVAGDPISTRGGDSPDVWRRGDGPG